MFPYVLDEPGSARCHLCLRLLKQFKYLRRHARTVHQVPPSGESAFVREAKAFRDKCNGSKHAFGPTNAPAAEAPPRYEYLPMFSESSGGESDSEAEETPRRKRVTREELYSSGFTVGLDGRCRASRVFEQTLVQTSGASPTTAARKAGVLFRYLEYTRLREPLMDDVQRVTCYHTALATVQEYKVHFSARSVVVLADALKSCVTLLQFARPLQDAFCFDPRRHQAAVAAGASMWTQQRSMANREAALRQRCSMTNDPLESWTHLLPVEGVIDYLRERGAAEDEPPAPRLCIMTAVDPATRRPPDSAHDRAVRRQAYARARSLAGLVLVLSGVRLCVALKLTVKDLRRAVDWGEAKIVSVRFHKTRKYHGAAHIVLRPHHLRVLTDLARATEDFFGPEGCANRNLFGLTTPHGRACKEIFQDFNDYVAKRGYDPTFKSLRFNQARSAAESFSHLLGNATDEALDGASSAQRAITDFLLHSKRVGRAYYRKTSYSSLITQWTAFNHLLAVMYLLEAARAGRLELRVHNGKL